MVTALLQSAEVSLCYISNRTVDLCLICSIAAKYTETACFKIPDSVQRSGNKLRSVSENLQTVGEVLNTVMLRSRGQNVGLSLDRLPRPGLSLANLASEMCYPMQNNIGCIHFVVSLQCFDTVGWVTGRASGL